MVMTCGFQGRFPHVRHIGTGHHQVQRTEILGGIAHDARSPSVHHQIDLAFCMVKPLPDMKEIQQEITPITNEDLFIILNHPNAHLSSVESPTMRDPRVFITRLISYSGWQWIG